jgi:hypothetical protein
MWRLGQHHGQFGNLKVGKLTISGHPSRSRLPQACPNRYFSQLDDVITGKTIHTKLERVHLVQRCEIEAAFWSYNLEMPAEEDRLATRQV